MGRLPPLPPDTLGIPTVRVAYGHTYQRWEVLFGDVMVEYFPKDGTKPTEQDRANAHAYARNFLDTLGQIRPPAKSKTTRRV